MNNANAMAHLPGRPTVATAKSARHAWLVAASAVLDAIATFSLQASAAPPLARSKGARRFAALGAWTLAGLLASAGAQAQGATPLAGATGIAAGDRHACALLSTGGIKCWGNNNYGKLGDGSTIASSYAVDVQGVANAVDVAAGQNYGCAVTDTGGVKCWGLEPQWNHGSGSFGEVRGMYDVSGLDGMTALKVAAGALHACAIVDTGTETGAIRCWGSNEYGQLGNGATSSSEYLPVQVVGISDATAIAAGGSHTCAIVAGGVKCWGNDWFGQLGDSGTLGSSAVPVDVTLGQTALAIAAGENHTCALLASGGVACWGWNYYGQAGALPYYLSNGAEVVGPTAVPVFGATVVGAGGSDSCAVIGSGASSTVACWGGSNTNASGAQVPTAVAGLSGAISVAVGGVIDPHDWSPNTHCALVGDGVQCWGGNDVGQLGNGYTENAASPVDVVDITNAGEIAAGAAHTCAADAGSVKSARCWGANDYGQLGNATRISSNVPVRVYDFSATQIAAGEVHTCALQSGGGVRCWGSNLWGQLGHPPSYDIPGLIDPTKPVQVPDLADAIQVVVGIGHSCALMGNGTVRCWGWNARGQLGLGDTLNRDSPVEVPGLAGVEEIAAGAVHTCARIGGSIKCWGNNFYGQLGNGGQSDVNPSPLDVSGMSTATQMTAGYDHTCARLGDGSAKCWGGIRLGNGDGTVSTSKVPVSINTSPGIPLQGVLQISAGTGHTCAIVTGNTAKCWGDNLYGQLGNGGTASFPEYPVDVVGLNGVPLADVVKLSAGRAYTCAITAGAFGNRVKCWGAAINGQLGDGRTGLHGEPATVLLAPNAGVTTTTLSASPGASSYGQPVTLTATVHNGNAPTGFVEFSANDFYIAGCESVALTGGQAQCVTSALPIGTNTLKATYGGDTGNAASSGTLSYEVTRATVTLTITAHTPDPSAVLSPVMVSVALVVAPGTGTPTGTVAVSRGVDGCTITLPATSCSFSPSVAGTAAIAAQYGGDANFAPQSAAPVSHTTTALPQAITFPPIPDLALGNAPFLVSATASSGLTVSFASATPAVCTVSGNTVALVGAGTCTITGNQPGNATYAVALQVDRTFTVGKAVTTLAITGSTLASSPALSPVTVTVALASGASGVVPPSGAVAVARGSDGCTITLPATSCALTPTATGTVDIVASYGGDGNFLPSTASPFAHTATALVQNITFDAIANQTLGNPPVALSATGGASGNPVVFASSTPLVCTLSGSMVTLVGAGMCTLTADQAGNATYAPATQAVQSFSVGKASATLVLSSSVNPSTPGQSVTFTLAASGAAGTPAGTVTFSDGGAPLCSNVALDAGGSASCTTSTLGSGTHAIAADYSGDAKYLPGTATLAQIISTAGPPAAYAIADVDYPAASDTEVRALTDNGKLTGLATLGGIPTPFTYASGAFAPLPGGSGFAEVSTWGIAGDGTVVGGASDSAASPTAGSGFTLAGSTYSLLARPGWPVTEVRGVNAAGTLVGYAFDPGASTSVTFIYDPATTTYTDIAIAAPGWRKIAQAINAAGQVVGSVDDGTTAQGFLRETNGTVTPFQVSGLPTYARGINDAGVIAGYVIAGGVAQGFVGNATNGYETLVVPGAVETVPLAINNAGQVAGYWVDSSGKRHGFIATPGQLPVGTTVEGGFQFDVAVVGGQPVFIDPAVAVGYDYAIGAGDPLFVAVRLPIGFGDNQYTVTAGGISMVVAGGDVHDLRAHNSPSGVAAFRVTGIETSAYVDPEDPRGFPTEVTFAASGRFTGTQTPIVVDAPWPSAMTVSATPNPARAGQWIAYAATVTSPGGTPEGTVTFSEGQRTLCTAVLSAGVAQCSGHPMAIGDHAITARYAGNAEYAAATGALTLSVRTPGGKSTQSISFAPLPERTTVDPPFSVSATASSGLPVAFKSMTSFACKVSGNVVTLTKVGGACLIVALQGGNASTLPALPVTRMFLVRKSRG